MDAGAPFGPRSLARVALSRAYARVSSRGYGRAGCSRRGPRGCAVFTCRAAASAGRRRPARAREHALARASGSGRPRARARVARVPGRSARDPGPAAAPVAARARCRAGPRSRSSARGGRRARARDCARAFAAELARAGVAIVSRPRLRHRRAPRTKARSTAGGATVAVLASGLDRVTPAGQRRLAERILAGGGAWLSERTPGDDAHPYHFPERNRLISGLARVDSDRRGARAQRLAVERAPRARAGPRRRGRARADRHRCCAAAPTACCATARRRSSTRTTCATPCSAPLAARAARPARAEPSRRRRARVLAHLADGPATLDALRRALGRRAGRARRACCSSSSSTGRVRREGARLALRAGRIAEPTSRLCSAPMAEPVQVIGGGLAGCEAAWQLARRGVAVRALRDAAASAARRRTRATTSRSWSARTACARDAPENAVGPAARGAAPRRLAGARGGRRAAACPPARRSRSTASRSRARSARASRREPDDRARAPRGARAARGRSPSSRPGRSRPTRSPSACASCAATHSTSTTRSRRSCTRTASTTSGCSALRAGEPARRRGRLSQLAALARGVPRVRRRAGARPRRCRCTRSRSRVYFEGCLPIEVMAERGAETLAFGPMKPVGLEDPRGGAGAVRGRAAAPGGQGAARSTTWSASRRSCASASRSGSSARCPASRRRCSRASARCTATPSSARRELLDERLAAPRAAAAALRRARWPASRATSSRRRWACSRACSSRRRRAGDAPLPPPPTTALGALLAPPADANPRHFQPMNVNFGLFPPLDGARRRARRAASATRGWPLARGDRSGPWLQRRRRAARAERAVTPRGRAAPLSRLRAPPRRRARPLAAHLRAYLGEARQLAESPECARAGGLDRIESLARAHLSRRLPPRAQGVDAQPPARGAARLLPLPREGRRARASTRPRGCPGRKRERALPSPLVRRGLRAPGRERRRGARARARAARPGALRAPLRHGPARGRARRRCACATGTATAASCASTARAARSASSRCPPRRARRCERGSSCASREGLLAQPLFTDARGGALSDRGVRVILRRRMLRGRHRAPREPAHAATLVRDAPARRRRRPARDPGAARPRAALHHPALYPCLRGAPGARLPRRPPAREGRLTPRWEDRCPANSTPRPWSP